MLALACVIGILGLSAPTSCSSGFFYSQNTFHKPEECQVCFEKDCLTIDKARCDFYAEADSLLPKDVEETGGIEDGAKRKEVDELIYDLVGKELSNTMECIPYVSRYTNCNKDNVCFGCKTCACNPDGMWNCTTMQPCHSQHPPLNVDHRVLLMIMEALSDTAHPKKTKRSVSDQSEDIRKKDVTDTPMAFLNLSEWLYAVTSLNGNDTSPTDATSITEFTVIEPDYGNATEAVIATTETDPASTLSEVITTGINNEATSNSNADYVAFDEVLRNIAVDINNYNRKKSLDNTINNQTFNIDYLLMDEENATIDTPNDNMTNFTVDFDDISPESKIASATKVVIDLLETASRLDANANGTRENINNNKYDYPNVFENTNDILDYNVFNIMKRDVADQENITTPSVEPTVTVIVNTPNENIAKETLHLKENVIMPLNKIIAEKIKEFENLKKIKENLLKFLKIEGQLDGKGIENITSNTYFSIYNNTIATSLDIDLRRSNPNKYEKYMLKLKRDIFEVIRDIIGIQKNKDSDIPNDLKLLLRAMKGYVYRNHLIEKQKTFEIRGPKGFRRNMEQTSSRCDRLSFKDCIFKIIEVIDKDMPKSKALFPLSPTSRKIVKHVIKSYYIDQFVIPGIHDPHYNLTHYLNSIGSKWKEMTANLISSIPFASLHRIKLLHCFITLDLGKMNDALSLMEFARSRRMVSSLDSVNEDTFGKIDAGLMAIHNKVQLITQYYEQIPMVTINKIIQADTNETTTKPLPTTTMKSLTATHKKKSHSFIKHIRSLLKASRKDIAQFLHRDVPKSEIVKQLARKRLTEMSNKRYSEYEETMKRWQRNLELVPRIKRSNSNQFKTRTKNIIPRYLTRLSKVDPRIKGNRKKATADVKKKKKEVSRRNRKASKKPNPNRRNQQNARHDLVPKHSTMSTSKTFIHTKK